MSISLHYEEFILLSQITLNTKQEILLDYTLTNLKSWEKSVYHILPDGE